MKIHRSPSAVLARPLSAWAIVALINIGLFTLLARFTLSPAKAQSDPAILYISPEEASNRTLVDTQDDAWRAAVQNAQSCSNFQIGLLNETANTTCGTGKTGDCINPTTFANGQVISYTLRNLAPNGPPLGNPDSWLSGQGDGCGVNSSELQDGAPRPTGIAGCYYNDAASFRGDNSNANAVLFTFQQPVQAFGAWFGDLESKSPGTNYYHAGKDGGSGVGGALASLRLVFEDGSIQQMPITPTLAPVTTWLSPTAPPPPTLIGSGGNIGLCGGTDDPTDADGCGNETTRWVGFVAANPNNRVKQMLVAVGDDDHSGSGPSDGPNVQCSGGNANTCNAGTEYLSFIGPTLCLAPDLTINKSGWPDSVIAGGVVTYTLRYHNLIAGAVTGPITLTDQLPPGVTYRNTVAADPPATLRNASPQWRVESLPANTPGYITFTAQVDGAVTGPITNTATLVTPGEINLTNNQAQQQTTVLPLLGQLVVNKVVLNDHGGTASATEFPLLLNGQPITSGVTETRPAGVYTVTETNLLNYVGTFSGDCSATGGITLKPGDTQRCTLTNNDPPPTLGVLTVEKVVVNDAGGGATADDFPLFVNQQRVNRNVENLLPPGSYHLSESNLPGYRVTLGGDCTADGMVTLAAGEKKRCTLTNDDVAPTLTVHKIVLNDDGGTAQAGDFPLAVNGQPVTSGVTNTLAVGHYVVSEQNLPGYAATFSGDCAADGTIPLNLGEHKQCTITNDDLPPTLASLTVNKVVINDHGGTAIGSDFPLWVNGQPVLSGVAQILQPGTYSITETNQSGYTATYSGDCAADGTLTLTAGESKVCTLTNDDLAPALTVHKIVINNDGGGATASDFPLWIDQSPVNNGAANLLAAGVYTVSETNRAGYAATVSGDCAVDGRVALQIGETKSCTLTNDDLPPALGVLTVRKVVVNAHGGALTPPDFALFVNDQPVINGADNLLTPGTYTVREANQPGYAATFTGDCDATGLVTLVAGEHKTCTITNHDIAPTLTLHKLVINDHGGSANGLDFPLFVDKLRVASGVTTTLVAGVYTVQENDLLGYGGRIAGDCAADGRIQLQIGDVKQCTLINDDRPPSLGILTVRKIVVNDNGGQAKVGDFALAVNGQPVLSGVENILPPGDYQVSEISLPGYAATFSGDCTPAGLVRLTADTTQICVITNDDLAPTLTVEKVVTNDDGGQATVGDFPLFIDQQQVTSGMTTTLAVGDYRVSERSLPGYQPTFSGDCDSTGQVTLALGAVKRCTLHNDDYFASLGDRVWNDRNLDGQQAEDEPGIAGMTVRLYDPQGNLISSTVTGLAGDYLFNGLLPGAYVVAFNKNADFVFTLPDQGAEKTDSDVNPDSGRTGVITLGPSEHRRDVDAGLYQLAALGNFVWNDLNGNGVQEENEPGLGGIWVTLYDASRTVVGITQSNGEGFYGFTDLPPGAYTIKFELPPEYRFTQADAGDDRIDNDAEPATGETTLFHLGPNDVNLTLKAGVLAYPLLRLHKTTGQSAIEISHQAATILTYTLTYSNVGAVPAWGAVITETVPAATTFYARASTPGWQCAEGAPAGTACLLPIGLLPPQTQGSVVFAVTLAVAQPGPITVLNLAQLGDNQVNTARGADRRLIQAAAPVAISPPTALDTAPEPVVERINQLYLPLVSRE